MKSTDAAEVVLKEAGEPLHYREITRRILERKLWPTEGKTPEATLGAQLGLEISQRGDKSRFQRTDGGTFALREWGLPEYVPVRKGETGETDKLPPAKPSPTLSFTNAAQVVLEKYGERKPMHYRDITEKMLVLGLIQTKGLTPEATLYAQILTEIKRKQRRGEPPRFAMHGKGYVGLRRWMGEGLAFQIGRHNAEVHRKLMSKLRKLPPAEFEELVGQLLVAMGFEDVAVTRLGGDRGIDVRGTLVVGDVIRTRMAVQAKKWKANVQSPVVQQVRGSLGAHEQGLIITTSGFSSGARKEAERPDATPVALMDGKQFVALLIENDIGIQRTSYDLIDLEEGEVD